MTDGPLVCTVILSCINPSTSCDYKLKTFFLSHGPHSVIKNIRHTLTLGSSPHWSFVLKTDGPLGWRGQLKMIKYRAWRAYLNGPDGLELLGLCKDDPMRFEGPSLTDTVRAHDPKSLSPRKALKSENGNPCSPRLEELEVESHMEKIWKPRRKSQLFITIKDLTPSQIEVRFNWPSLTL